MRNNKTQVYIETAEEIENWEEEKFNHQNLMGLTWKFCLLIDLESSVDVFKNKKNLMGIHKVE